jgi:hypothetical protein
MEKEKIMKIRFAMAVCAALALAAGLAWTQDLRTVHFGGVINDYGPSTISGGPYEMRGEWSVDVDRTGSGSFSADLTMETSDYGITDSTQVDPTNPATRMAHTHHITMSNAVVSYDTSVCPANNPATTGSGVVVTGTATTAANGGPAPFESKGASTLQVCITGGSEVEFSNVTLVYTGPATTHFGPQPIHGTVKIVSTK